MRPRQRERQQRIGTRKSVTSFGSSHRKNTRLSLISVWNRIHSLRAVLFLRRFLSSSLFKTNGRTIGSKCIHTQITHTGGSERAELALWGSFKLMERRAWIVPDAPTIRFLSYNKGTRMRIHPYFYVASRRNIYRDLTLDDNERKEVSIRSVATCDLEISQVFWYNNYFNYQNGAGSR